MSAALNIPRSSYFDRSEIIPELELVFKQHEPIKPVKAGEMLPDFTLQKENAKWQQFFNGNEIGGSVLFRQLLSKPLVIGFYSNLWQEYGLDFLKQLNAIQHEINARGGNILIISDEKSKVLDKLVWEHSLSLNFYFDSNYAIAEKFRIYNDNDPIWNKFSGIDVNVPLLAVYVVSNLGEIKYDHVSFDLSQDIPARDIISSFEQAGPADDKIRNINNPVRVNNIK